MFKLLVFGFAMVTAVASQTIGDCCEDCVVPLTPYQMGKVRACRKELGVEDNKVLPSIFDPVAMEKARNDVIQVSTCGTAALGLFSQGKLIRENIVKEAMTMNVSREAAEYAGNYCVDLCESNGIEEDKICYCFDNCFFTRGIVDENTPIVDSEVCRNSVARLKAGDTSVADSLIYKLLVLND